MVPNFTWVPTKTVVTDVAGWRMERMSELPTTDYFALPPTGHAKSI
jgi:hypothetical protein